MGLKLELIAFGIESCLQIENGGAHRVELCDNPGEGGTTPAFGFIKTARKLLSKELYPIIRPRGGDFLYTAQEFELMRTDVKVCKELGCDGVVLGILKKDGSIDVDRCARLVELAYPLGVCFHRAFDRIRDAKKGLEDVIQTGCERILTSGLQPTAEEGSQLIKELISQAAGRITIMPGSGIRAANIRSIIQNTGATELHSSARIQKESEMEYSNPALNEKPVSISIDTYEMNQMVAEIRTISMLDESA